LSKLKDYLPRVIKAVLVVELAYLVLVNTALQLPLTQDLVNLIRPEKFQVRWDRAWSPYPFRVYVSGLQANGQSRSQQWQLRVDKASGSISLPPLVLKHVSLSNVSAENVDYRQRPRLKADKDYSELLPHFPKIQGRQIQPADLSPRAKKLPWKVSVENSRAAGTFKVWLYNFRGSATGSTLVDLTLQTRGGPFGLNLREMDLALSPAYANGKAELFQGGRITGQLAFDPFVPRENKGLRMLPFMQLDTQLNLDVGSLSFINLFTANLGDFFIDGAGRITGRLHYGQGYMRSGTDLLARAADLSVHIQNMEIQGQGAVQISTPAQSDKPMQLAIGYEALSVTRDGAPSPFLMGDSLKLTYSGSNLVVPESDDLNFETLLNDQQHRERRRDNTLLIDIDEATLVDMAILNDYLPASTALKFTSGTARLDADIFAGSEDMKGGLKLQGTRIGMRADEQDLQGDLEVDLVIAEGVARELRIDLAGSSITLDKVNVAGEQQTFEDKDWSARIEFSRAELIAEEPLRFSADADLQISDTRPLLALINNHGDPPEWMLRALFMNDIVGEATVELADNRLSITDAMVESDEAEIAAKAVFYETGRDGMIYARYRKLDFVLKMEGESSNLDVIRARQTFDQYQLKSR
jgi:hypothetical protein